MTIATSSPSSTLPAAERAVLEVIRGVYAAWAANDADAFAALYVDDATVVQPGGISRKAVRTCAARWPRRSPAR